MSETIISVALAAVIVALYFYRRSQKPNHLTEIYNGLILKSDLAQARENDSLAIKYKEMAEAIRDTQRLVLTSNLSASDNINLVQVRLINATNGSVLDDLSIFEQNHRHDCYKAIMNLAEKLNKVHPK